MQSSDLQTYHLLQKYPSFLFQGNSVIYDSQSNRLKIILKRTITQEEEQKVDEYFCKFLDAQADKKLSTENLETLLKNSVYLSEQKVEKVEQEQEAKKARTQHSHCVAIRNFLDVRGYTVFDSASGKPQMISTKSALMVTDTILVKLGTFETFRVSLSFLKVWFPTLHGLSNGTVQDTRILQLDMGTEESSRAIALAVKSYITKRAIVSIATENLLEALEFVHRYEIEKLKNHYVSLLIDILKKHVEIDIETICHIWEASLLLSQKALSVEAQKAFMVHFNTLLNHFKRIPDGRDFNKIPDGRDFNKKLNTIRSYFTKTLPILSTTYNPDDVYLCKALPCEFESMFLNSRELYSHLYILEEIDKKNLMKVDKFAFLVTDSLSLAYQRDGLKYLPNIEEIHIGLARQIDAIPERLKSFILNLKSLNKVKKIDWSEVNPVGDFSEYITEILQVCPTITSFSSSKYIPDVEDLAHLTHLKMSFPNIASLKRVIEKCKKLQSLEVMGNRADEFNKLIPDRLKPKKENPEVKK
jgi:hypothetical protein